MNLSKQLPFEWGRFEMSVFYPRQDIDISVLLQHDSFQDGQKWVSMPHLVFDFFMGSNDLQGGIAKLAFNCKR